VGDRITPGLYQHPGRSVTAPCRLSGMQRPVDGRPVTGYSLSTPMNPYQPPSVEADTALPAPATVEPFTSVGGLFVRALSLYFRSLPLIAGVTLVVFVPVELVKNYVVTAAHLEDSLSASTRIEGLLEGIFGSLVTAALLSGLAHKIRTGRDLGVRGSLSAGVERWGSVLGVRVRSGFMVVVGIFLLVVPGIVWMVRYSLTDQVATLERSASRTMNRSVDLVRGHGWKVFGVGLLGFITVLLPQFAGAMLAGLADSWIVTALIDCVNDVVYRFFVVLMLLVYLGIAKDTSGERLGERA
jgi:hypothetical protein